MRLNLKRLGLLAGKAARVFAMQVGLTPQRLDLLLLVRDSYPLTQREIAERLCVSAPVVSRMLAALEHDHLIYRLPDERDPRAKVTYLTEGGRARVDELFAPGARRGAQATGEGIWLGEWRYRIAALGIRVDSILRARPPRHFDRLARWNREYVPNATPREPAPPPPQHDPVLVASFASVGIDYDKWTRGEYARIEPPS